MMQHKKPELDGCLFTASDQWDVTDLTFLLFVEGFFKKKKKSSDAISAYR